MAVTKFERRVADRLQQILNQSGLTQSELADRTQKLENRVNQATVSKMLKSAQSMSLKNIISVGRILNVDFNKLFSEEDSDDITAGDTHSNEKNSQLTRRADRPEMRPYLGSYYVYFFPTLKDENNLLCGKLQFKKSADISECIAELEFETGKLDKNKNPIVKTYTGQLVLSSIMSAAYCTLINEEIGEISFLLFRNFPILYEDMLCKMALVLTCSAGSERIPTVHRMIISKIELKPEELEELKGQLYLNKSKIIISKLEMEKFLRDERLNAAVKEWFSEKTSDGQLKNVDAETYYTLEESRIIKSTLSQTESNQAINLLRQYSISPKNNKIGEKCEKILYGYVEKAKKGREKEKSQSE